MMVCCVCCQVRSRLPDLKAIVQYMKRLPDSNENDITILEVHIRGGRVGEGWREGGGREGWRGGGGVKEGGREEGGKGRRE